MEIGVKIKELRVKKQLTQDELASRCELTRGFISQIENDITSPSIGVLKDILDALGTSLSDFFSQDDEKIVFTEEDRFSKSGQDSIITWLVPTAQKNMMEPIIFELSAGAKGFIDLPHEGEEFGFILEGGIHVTVGGKTVPVKKGESFYFKSAKAHYITNPGKINAKLLWISCPPNF